MPDLSNAKNLEFFLKWDGTSKHAHLIKLRRVKLSDASTTSKQADKCHEPPEEELSEEKKDQEDEEEEEEEQYGQSDDDGNVREGGADEEERTDSMDVDLKPDS